MHLTGWREILTIAGFLIAFIGALPLAAGLLADNGFVALIGLAMVAGGMWAGMGLEVE